jgi:hypothetical protein
MPVRPALGVFLILSSVLLSAGCGAMGEPANQPIAAIAFLPQPAVIQAGESFNPVITVEVRDPDSNRVITAAIPVTISLKANPGGATLSGTLTVISNFGRATFSDLMIDKVGTGYTLTASAAGLQPVTSAAFAVVPGPVALAFLVQPDSAEGQVLFDRAIQVSAHADRFGNVVPDAPVTLALGVNPWSDVLGGTTTVMAVNGVATFSDLSLALPGQGITLEATSGTGIPVQSNAFRVRTSFVQVSAGDSYSCGVTVVGFAYCWGYGYGLIPHPVPGRQLFSTLSAGTSYTCGIGTNGTTYCWAPNSAPAPVGGNLAFAQVSVGNGHICGVTTSNAAYCWGSNGLGQLGDSTNQQRLTPTLVAGNHSFIQISAGYLANSCGVTSSHAAYCWGNNTTGQLGDSTGNHQNAPSPVAGGHAFVAVSAGREHACGLTTADAVLCWGDNGGGQLGDGTSGVRIVPTPATGGISFAMVSAGEFRHTCGVSTGNEAYCWGYGISGQLGTSVPGILLDPTVVAGGLSFAQVSAGDAHSCGLTTAHQVYCWGVNSNGQIGDGNTLERDTPMRVIQ